MSFGSLAHVNAGFDAMPALVIISIVLVVFVVVCVILKKILVRVGPGQALVVKRLEDHSRVSFRTSVVLPAIHSSGLVDLRTKVIVVQFTGSEGLHCADNVRFDIEARFTVRINRTAEDVLWVSEQFGVDKSWDEAAVSQIFMARFREAVATVVRSMRFAEVMDDRSILHHRIIEQVGCDLNGYVLEELAIGNLQPVPLAAYDDQNMLDASGKRWLLERAMSDAVVAATCLHDIELRVAKKMVAGQPIEFSQSQSIQNSPAEVGSEVQEETP